MTDLSTDLGGTRACRLALAHDVDRDRATLAAMGLDPDGA